MCWREVLKQMSKESEHVSSALHGDDWTGERSSRCRVIRKQREEGEGWWEAGPEKQLGLSDHEGPCRPC